MSKVNKSFFKNFVAVSSRDRPLPGHTASSTEIILVSINVTGTRVVTSRTDKSIRIWKSTSDSLIDPVVIEEAHARLVERVSWDPKREFTFASVGRDDLIKIWKTTGVLERLVKVKKELGQSEAPSLKIVAYSNDGELIAVVDRDSTVLLYAVEKDYQKVGEIKLNEHVYDLKWFNGAHTYFACTLHDGTTPIYKVDDEITLKATLKGHRSSATTLAVDPRGTYAAIGSNEGVISIWNTATMLNSKVITEVDESIALVDCSRDGTYVAATYDRESNMRVFDVESSEQVYEVPNSVSGQLTFGTIAWFPNKTAFVFSSDHGTTLSLMKKPERV